MNQEQDTVVAKTQDRIRVYRNIKTVLTQGMFPGGYAPAILESQRYLDTWEDGLMETLPPEAQAQMRRQEQDQQQAPQQAPQQAGPSNGSGKAEVVPMKKKGKRGRKPKVVTTMPSA